jgi:molybdate transport system substrate-binding protein
MKRHRLPDLLPAALLVAALCLLPARMALADGPIITTGLGYKPMVQQLCAAYMKSTGHTPTEMYSGNIGQMIEQAKAGSGANIFISDKATLQESGLQFASFQNLGEAVLVLAWRKGVTITNPQDLKKPEIAKIGYPDAKAAIYGRAAVAFLKGNTLFESLKPKLSMLSTVPQVFSYLISGDLDAAFVNEAIVRKQGEALGGWMAVSEGFSPLQLAAGVVKGQEDNPEVRAFIQFLTTREALDILVNNGLRTVPRL